MQHHCCLPTLSAWTSWTGLCGAYKRPAPTIARLWHQHSGCSRLSCLQTPQVLPAVASCSVHMGWSCSTVRRPLQLLLCALLLCCSGQCIALARLPYRHLCLWQQSWLLLSPGQRDASSEGKTRFSQSPRVHKSAYSSILVARKGTRARQLHNGATQASRKLPRPARQCVENYSDAQRAQPPGPTPGLQGWLGLAAIVVLLRGLHWQQHLHTRSPAHQSALSAPELVNRASDTQSCTKHHRLHDAGITASQRAAHLCHLGDALSARCRSTEQQQPALHQGSLALAPGHEASEPRPWQMGGASEQRACARSCPCVPSAPWPSSAWRRIAAAA